LFKLTLTLRRIAKIFSSVGFKVEEGPEIEDDYHNLHSISTSAEGSVKGK
jgi:phenylalanyl-tRNA synthetase alpha chain